MNLLNLLKGWRRGCDDSGGRVDECVCNDAGGWSMMVVALDSRVGEEQVSSHTCKCMQLYVWLMHMLVEKL